MTNDHRYERRLERSLHDIDERIAAARVNLGGERTPWVSIKLPGA